MKKKTPITTILLSLGLGLLPDSSIASHSNSHINPQEIINQAKQYCGTYWSLETLLQRPPEACLSTRFPHATNKTCEYHGETYTQHLDQECTLIGVCADRFANLPPDSTQETRSSIGFCITDAFNRLQDIACCQKQPPPLQGDPKDFDGSRLVSLYDADLILVQMSGFIRTICDDTSWARPRRGCPIANDGYMTHVPPCPANSFATYPGKLKDACETWFDQRRKSIQWDQRSFSRILLDVILMKQVPNDPAAWRQIKHLACCKDPEPPKPSSLPSTSQPGHVVVHQTASVGSHQAESVSRPAVDDVKESKGSPPADLPSLHNLQQQQQQRQKKQHAAVDNNHNHHNNKGGLPQIEWECTCHDTGPEHDARDKRKKFAVGAVVMPGAAAAGAEEVIGMTELVAQEVVIVDAIQPPASGAVGGTVFGVLVKTAGGTFIWFTGVVAAFGTIHMVWKTAAGVWLMVPTAGSLEDQDQADGSSSISGSNASSSSSSSSSPPSPSSLGFITLLEGIEVEAQPKRNVSNSPPRPPTYDVHPWAMKVPEGKSG
ncbi:hypothetical protein CP532_4424 [Ophiocordyceps camponoti-leonardi (nom. inval.)]|nr:hypothetical protein CP532_4424 [Ophiocordyceps camponoti-leonardi (nom. inval.)]